MKREKRGERKGKVRLNLQHRVAKVTSKWEATRFFFSNAKVRSDRVEFGKVQRASSGCRSSRFVKSFHIFIKVRHHELWSASVNRFRLGVRVLFK